MSEPREPLPVKLVASLFSEDSELIEKACSYLETFFGPLDWKSNEIPFDKTRYYEKEMGGPLLRRFVSFERLISYEEIADIKIRTNTYEKGLCVSGRRTINIDPGCISAERLILVTGKNYTHRVYLRRGIYADLTLIYQAGSFRGLPWTYPDYGDKAIIELFNGVRARYMEQIRRNGY
ncbi:MAG: GTP-binding protein [Deltaproteobacteria bacterium CG23_combo_of_CG06-09_8_20_14_all_51_20]|nr:DUF4416 family protein [bacterium]OIP42913.1 MAG: GTP-binding protein [Desulfobacteraceae bacterium CG2_30_51_40]PIP47906.1 MAG: GTP-binding protein [Deltaproteobacteria bacterium CG23_combo_of_CG06-09_8_20_14_all_51_20]PJB37554.1 MAG: DUF4416 domain-containing protein [Deltaproteobacteria bacterium CG_4_9_14_3_um_filter_51_14]